MLPSPVYEVHGEQDPEMTITVIPGPVSAAWELYRQLSQGTGNVVEDNGGEGTIVKQNIHQNCQLML